MDRRGEELLCNVCESATVPRGMSMPRKSAAALSVIGPAPPPTDGTQGSHGRIGGVWDTIVSCRPPEYFDGACHHLLKEYCRHAEPRT